MGFSLFDFYGSKLSVKMVYDGLVVFEVSPIFGPYSSNSCPWQVSMGLSATV